jgi:hypothetical protein
LKRSPAIKFEGGVGRDVGSLVGLDVTGHLEGLKVGVFEGRKVGTVVITINGVEL